MTISFLTPHELMQQLAHQAKQRRLQLNLTQVGLARRAGVSLGSLKRFEHSGEISLKSFLKVVLVLDNLQHLEKIFMLDPLALTSLDDLIKFKTPPKKGRLQ